MLTYWQAEEQGFSEFHLYVCVAFLVKWSDKLRKMDFQEVMMFLQALPTRDWTEKDIELLLSEAFIWQSLFKGSSSHLKGGSSTTPSNYTGWVASKKPYLYTVSQHLKRFLPAAKQTLINRAKSMILRQSCKADCCNHDGHNLLYQFTSNSFYPKRIWTGIWRSRNVGQEHWAQLFE